MLSRILGVQRGPEAACFCLEPTPDPDGVVTWTEGSVETVKGTYESGWRRTEPGMEYYITVPANTAAVLRLPVQENGCITENGKSLAEAEGVEKLGYEDGRVVLSIQSGSYRFCVLE